MTKIKICGLKRMEDIEIVNRYMPDYIGFIFAESKREITMEQGKAFVENLDKKIKKVGVFVDESIEKILEIADYCKLDVIQLHGDESVEYCREIKKYYEVWKSFSVRSNLDEERGKLIEKLNRYKGVVDIFLVDTYSKKTRGGTGEKFNWDKVEGLSSMYRLILAGGITIKNLEESIKKVNPEIIDISSGVEILGIKDEIKIRNLLLELNKINNN